MTIRAELADGRVLEFPDDTPQDVIQATVRRMVQQAAPQDPRIQLQDLLIQQSSAPTPERAQQIAQLRQQTGVPGDIGIAQRQEGFPGAGVIEPAAAIVSGALAEPIAGLAGIIDPLNPFSTAAGPAEAVQATREALTFQPTTPAGQAGLQELGQVAQRGIEIATTPLAGLGGLATLAGGGGLQEAARTIQEVQQQGVSTTLGNKVLEVTGSPELAAIAHTLPTAALEALGVKGLKSLPKTQSNLSRNIGEAITQAAPSIKTLKAKSSELFDKLDQNGITIKPQVFDNFVEKLTAKLRKEGLDPTLTPDSTAALTRLTQAQGTPKTFTELQTLRQIASNAAGSIRPQDARLGNIILNELDKGIDQLATTVGKDAKTARSLWRRAKKSQDIVDMVENAALQASGLENGLRIGARQILRSKKKRRGFTSDERKALRKISEGTTAGNAAKFLGKFGISEGQATSMLGFSVGAGGGGALGAAFAGAEGAAVGAITIPVLGQFAKRTAQKITINNVKLADELVRAGPNAREVVKAYFKNTPKAQRNINDLTDLLADPNIDINALKNIPESNKLLTDAVFFAKELRRISQTAGSLGVLAAPALPRQGQQ